MLRLLSLLKCFFEIILNVHSQENFVVRLTEMELVFSNNGLYGIVWCKAAYFFDNYAHGKDETESV